MDSVPSYLRYKEGALPQHKYFIVGNRPKVALSPQEALVEANGEIHERILGGRRNQLCAHCSRFDFKTLYYRRWEDRVHSVWDFVEAESVFAKDIAGFLGPRNATWFIQQRSLTTCRLCNVIEDYYYKRFPQVAKIPGFIEAKMTFQQDTLYFDPATNKISQYSTCCQSHEHENVPLLELGPVELRLQLPIRPLITGEASQAGPAHSKALEQLHICVGRRPVQDLVDYDRIMSWIWTCIESHDHALQPFSEAMGPLPQIRLIDVERKCIIRSAPSSKYAALSYTWGICEQYLLTRDRVQALTEPASLYRCEPELTPVVKDALQVCERLGIPYLWCDALCIVQDDHEELSEQVARMDMIYSHAYITIVSAGSNQQQDGIARVSKPVVNTASTLAIDGVTYAIAEAVGTSLDNSVWATRGWTYQELLLSSRRLFFTDTEAIFHCSHGIFAEPLCPMDGTDKQLANWRTKVLNFRQIKEGIKSTYSSYFSLVANYVPRTLSYDSDYYRAFIGIANREITRLGQIHWGLPERQMVRALLWEVHAEPNSSFTMRRLPAFPSWSWAGWKFQGRLAFQDTIADRTISDVHYDRRFSDMVHVYRGTKDNQLVALLDRHGKNNWIRGDPFFDEDEGYFINARAFNEFLRRNNRLTTSNKLDPKWEPKSSPALLATSLSQVLVFQASLGKFELSRRSFAKDHAREYGHLIKSNPFYTERAGFGFYQLGDSSHHTDVQLRHKWRNEQADEVDCILLGETTEDPKSHQPDTFNVMLVEKIGDIYYRVAIPRPMNKLQWLHSRTRTETVILG